MFKLTINGNKIGTWATMQQLVAALTDYLTPGYQPLRTPDLPLNIEISKI